MRRVFAAVAILGAVVLAWFIQRFGLPFAWSYLIAINAVVLSLYGYDKSVAKIGWLRVPEAVLHATTLAGGTPGAFVGQNLFSHKTAKGRFRRTFWLIVFVQVAVFAAWIFFTRD
ncbi:MAG: DUF1294 domain-containing protein [Planctomycetaceae bacterium]